MAMTAIAMVAFIAITSIRITRYLMYTTMFDGRSCRELLWKPGGRSSAGGGGGRACARPHDGYGDRPGQQRRGGGARVQAAGVGALVDLRPGGHRAGAAQSLLERRHRHDFKVFGRFARVCEGFHEVLKPF